MSPKEQSENYKGSRMYLDLGTDLKKFVKSESKRRHITQAKFIRDCIRAEKERIEGIEHEQSDS